MATYNEIHTKKYTNTINNYAEKIIKKKIK